ncbi:MAG: ABC transporter ATP-binding protein [Methanomassiliicoccaceae archaeon]|nr:ABC transporter ATP-binding protein [Methanomassiliicoccaceae archaeon]
MSDNRTHRKWPFSHSRGSIEEGDHSIVVENLSKMFKSYRKSGMPDKLAVDNISFSVKRGEIFGLLGPNGAGKTTTIRMLSTLLIPTSGRAVILGMDVSGGNIKEIRKRVNLVSGGERGLYYRLTGRQNLNFFSNLYDVDRNKQKELIKELLDIVDLKDFADVKVESYSRGMKQRMHIARALVNSPEILYLDEPTIGLDPEIAREIRSLIRKLADSGTTIILTTHYMQEAEELCDRIMIVSKGKSVGYGTLEKLRETVSDTNVVEIITNNDPHDAVAKLSAERDFIHINTERISGRYCTRIQTKDNEDILSELDALFSRYGLRKMGYDEPTLEDIYLSLVGLNES